MELASGTAVWFHYGKTPVPIRWVLVRDPQGEYETTCLLCTDPTLALIPVVEWFVMRWQVEVTFEEARRHLGIETQRHWPHHALVVGPVFLDYLGRSYVALFWSTGQRSSIGLVYQIAPDILGCVGIGSFSALGGFPDFSNIAGAT